ncbi:diguanylate cyclase (GGDEF)-like protein/PAS domain S-box-containing protein [Methylohalomonas lacus]|uniref:Diguanylate cyclase (GGDEF)-like protein/PAS domain S-box-containing protein n=1 Tax=Methylohalomonas lacus TaxID=398773 RepID=A0AAE3HLU2_9GAMM|nr:diguanylate cyclase [Methylohalomonas lacus]MCS3903496.1 diguanylate cyclase (GGDEF)-like protein/PAS domain S-box-containing protein [Methylohalomonas lacus]
MKDTASALCKRNILLVEDSANDAELIRQALDYADGDAALECVADEPSLIEALQRADWDVVLSDAKMPELDIEQVLDRIATLGHDIPVIIVSGRISDDRAVALIKHGAHDYVSKDHLERLPLAIERECEAAKTRTRLARHERIMANVTSRLPGYIFQRMQSVDGTFHFTYLSESLREQFGVDPDRLMANPEDFWELIHPDDRDALASVFAEAHARIEPYYTEYRAVLPDGRTSWVRVQAQPTRLANGDVVWDGIGLDISAEKTARERLNYMAYFDEVTGLPNRHLLFDRLDQAIRQCDRSSNNLALHMIDLDQFKQVNDTLGHAAGDRLLHQVAERLSGVIRQTDTLARIGGDEFVLMQTGVNQIAAAENLAGKLLANLAEPFRFDTHSVEVQISIGIAFYGSMFALPDETDVRTALIKRADQALYDAKSQGRNTWCLYRQAWAGAVDGSARA